MSEAKKKDDKVVERETEAKTRHLMVRLSDFAMRPELYCHRGPDGLTDEKVADLFEPLTREGLQVPVEFYTEDDLRKVLTKGHRRVTACRVLARRNTPHFSLDMEIPAIEVFDAPLKDRVVRAVMDNCKRKSYDNTGRIRAAVAMHKAGVPDSRAAVALGYSEQSLRRDLLVGEDDSMFDHVLKNHVGPTHAADILRVAESTKRLDQVHKDFDAWVANKEQEIQQKMANRKMKGLPPLSGAEQQVKSYLTGPLAKHWLDQIKAGQPFDDQTDWTFRAGYDPETHEVTVGNFKTNLDKEKPKNMVRMVAQMSQVQKQVLQVAKKRIEEEKRAAAVATATTDPFDLDLLRQEGLGDYADELAEQVRQQPTKDGEDDPNRDQVEERVETDLSSEIELPESTEEPAAQAPTTEGADNKKDAE